MVRVVSARTCVRVDSSIRNRARQNEIRANSINSLARQLFIFYKKRVSDTCINARHVFGLAKLKRNFILSYDFFFFSRETLREIDEPLAQSA